MPFAATEHSQSVNYICTMATKSRQSRRSIVFCHSFRRDMPGRGRLKGFYPASEGRYSPNTMDSSSIPRWWGTRLFPFSFAGPSFQRYAFVHPNPPLSKTPVCYLAAAGGVAVGVVAIVHVIDRGILAVGGAKRPRQNVAAVGARSLREDSPCRHDQFHISGACETTNVADDLLRFYRGCGPLVVLGRVHART